MSRKEVPSADYDSPHDMKLWLQQELRDIEKARKLRVKEATGLVNAYERGEISPEEADKRNWAYQKRWGEALPGVSAADGVTDEQILAAIDESRKKYVRPSARGNREGGHSETSR